jgi:hypothetical protein
VDFEISVVAVGFAGKQRLDLPGLHLAAHGAQCVFCLGNDAFVTFFLTEFDEADIVCQSLRQTFDRADSLFERLALTHQLLRFDGVVPEAGIFGKNIEVFKPFQGLIPVKDASSAGLSPA